MKNLCAVALLALPLAGLFLCGCNQNQEAELKARVDKLEAQQKLNARRLDELLALSKSYQDQNQKILNDLQGVILLQSTNMDKVGRLFLEHLGNGALHSWPKPVAARGRSPVADQRMKAAQTQEGVPLEIYNTIALQAIKEWPRDYQKQRNYIQSEIERYKRLHR